MGGANGAGRRPDPLALPNLRAATWRSAEAGRQGHDLTVETIKAVMAAGLAGIALLYAAGQPTDPRAPGRPFDEGVDSGRQRGPAAVLAMMDDKRARQRRRRAQDRHHIAAAAGVGA